METVNGKRNSPEKRPSVSSDDEELPKTHFEPVIYRRVTISLLGFIQVLLGFVMAALQISSCFHCERNAVDAKEYMGFGVSTSLETVLSGSAGFLCGRENMRPKSRCWLLIVTAVITSATCFQCGLLSILNIQQLSHTRKFNGSASNGSEEEADRNGPDQSSIPPLKISLVVMYLLAGILVAASASLLIYNLVVNRRRYRNPAKTEEMAKKKLMTAESTLMDSDAARRTSDLMRTRSNRSVVTSL